MTELSKAERYMQIKDEIEALEAEKKRLSEELTAGASVVWNGNSYTWAPYTRTSTSWKGCYEQAYALLDDEGQVIMGEFVIRKTATKVHHKFEKK